MRILDQDIDRAKYEKNKIDAQKNQIGLKIKITNGFFNSAFSLRETLQAQMESIIQEVDQQEDVSRLD